MAHRVTNRTRINAETLETMGAATLASVFVDHVKVDSILRSKLRLLLASKEDTGKLVA